jgi:hypothetical protein
VSSNPSTTKEGRKRGREGREKKKEIIELMSNEPYLRSGYTVNWRSDSFGP